MAKKRSLDEVTRNWVSDRLDNEESLSWGTFVSFAKEELGMDSKAVKKYKSKSYQKMVKARFAAGKKRLTKIQSRIGKW